MDKRRVRAGERRNQDLYAAHFAVKLARAGADIGFIHETLASRPRSNRRLSAKQLSNKYKHGGETKGVDHVLPDMRTGSPSDTGARQAPDIRHQAMPEASGEAENQAPVPSGRDGGEGSEGVAVRRDADDWLPHIQPTELPCCEGTEYGCRQHRQQAAIAHWYRAPKYTPGQFD